MILATFVTFALVLTAILESMHREGMAEVHKMECHNPRCTVCQ